MDYIKVMLDEGAFIPEKAHNSDAGFDIRTPVDFDLQPCKCSEISSVTINTGIHIELPEKTVGMLKSKSGLNVKHGITSEGVIDVGYTGAIAVKLYNHTNKTVSFKRGDKITQLVILPIIDAVIYEVSELNKNTERGDNGFGSSGR